MATPDGLELLERRGADALGGGVGPAGGGGGPPPGAPAAGGRGCRTPRRSPRGRRGRSTGSCAARAPAAAVRPRGGDPRGRATLRCLRLPRPPSGAPHV